jgi:semialdehyde dehydrogenase family protein
LEWLNYLGLHRLTKLPPDAAVRLPACSQWQHGYNHLALFQQQDTTMSMRVGIVGISGFGGGEALRLIAGHPSFELVYAAGESTAGSRLMERFPGVPAKLAGLVIEKWDPANLPKLDVLFAWAPRPRRWRAFPRT